MREWVPGESLAYGTFALKVDPNPAEQKGQLEMALHAIGQRIDHAAHMMALFRFGRAGSMTGEERRGAYNRFRRDLNLCTAWAIGYRILYRRLLRTLPKPKPRAPRVEHGSLFGGQ